MTETSRVQRWREEKRQHGLKALTIWLTAEEELRLKDLALQWHCSPSAVVQHALAQHSSPPNTSQIRELIRAEFLAMQAEWTPVTETVTETVTATVTEAVTETVTATLARDLPAMVREIVEGLAREALGWPVTDMFGDVADTEALSLPATDTFGDVTDTEDESTDTYGDVTETEMLGVSVTDTNGSPTDTAPPEEAPAPRRGGRPLGAMGQRIVALLGAHPEGLSAEEIRAYLKPERPLGDTLQSLRKRARVRTEGQGRDLRYFVA
jgi:hypothetical protein